MKRASGSASLTRRACVALALSVGFYAMALTIAGILFYLPAVEAEYSNGSPPTLLILWFVGAAIVWAIVPRPGRFEAPGPLLRRDEQPQLFALVDRIADAVGEGRPAEVYLVRDVNAFVSSRGGFLGFGRRRVLGVGLPLLQELTVSQLAGVLLHEFGHYHAGDVKLGPWIYGTRVAIRRTVLSLADSGRWSGAFRLLNKPFIWYGELFAKLTLAIARHQELEADAFAARAVGADAIVTALKATHAGGPAFAIYWQWWMIPALTAGLRPPLVGGFARFRATPQLVDRLETLVAGSAKTQESRWYDTHPALGARISHIEALRAGGALEAPRFAPDDRRGIDLLCDVDRVEWELLRAIAPDPSMVHELRKVDWETAGKRVCLETWRRRSKESAAALGTMTPATAPTDPAGLDALGLRLLGVNARRAPREVRCVHAARVIAASAARNLVASGWQIEAYPGREPILRRGAVELRPITVMHGLARGDAQPATWAELHTLGGISEVPLARAADDLEGEPPLPARSRPARPAPRPARRSADPLVDPPHPLEEERLG